MDMFWDKVAGVYDIYVNVINRRTHQALLFLEVMNWYDGIFIDKVWAGISRFWILPGCEELPYVQTWPQVLKKRSILTLIWIAGAAIVAGIVVLFAR